MLNNYRIVIFFLLVAVIAIWIHWWAASGFILSHEICSDPKTRDDCGVYDVLLYSAWSLGKAVDHWSALITAIATGAIGYFTLTLKRATNSLREASDQQLLHLESTANRQLRPYVWVKMTTVKYPNIAPDRIGIGFRITNSGQTWAQNVTIRTAIIPREFKVEYDPWDRAQWKVDEPIVLGPRQFLGLQLDNIWLRDIPAIFRNEKGFDYAIWITYDDTLIQPPILRQTQLCQRFTADKEGGTSFAYLPPHNCADEDCPEDSAAAPQPS